MIITLPELDPVAIHLGSFGIRWYSLAYIIGILAGLFWLKKSNEKRHFLTKEAYDDWITWAVLSIILGGRLGYVLFYNFSFFLHNPLEIFAFWHGGMSFHGGLAGMIFGMWLFSKKYKIDFLQLMDNLAVAAPIGLFCGRLANFMNMELYGRVSQGNFGIIFPNAGELPRHPSQLYEAALEGVLLFLILFFLQRQTRIMDFRGKLSGIFLILYGCFRILIENFREPDEQLGFIFGQITMGQLLSLPLFFLGFFLLLFYKKKKNSLR